MALTLTNEKELPLLSRKRYTFTWDHQGQSTPTRSSIKQEVATHLKTTPDLIAIRHIFTHYGSNTSKIIIHVYQDAATLKLLEPPKGKKAAPPAQTAAKK